MSLLGVTKPAAAGGKKPAPAAAKAPARTAAKKAPANMVEYDIRCESPGNIRLLGVIDSINGGTLILKHKRPSSSKFMLTPIAVEKILMIQGLAQVGEVVQITYASEKSVFQRLRKAMLEGYDDTFGMMKGTDDQGRPFMVRPTACNATTMSEIEAPPIQIDKKY